MVCQKHHWIGMYSCLAGLHDYKNMLSAELVSSSSDLVSKRPRSLKRIVHNIYLKTPTKQKEKTNLKQNKKPHKKAKQTTNKPTKTMKPHPPQKKNPAEQKTILCSTQTTSFHTW